MMKFWKNILLGILIVIPSQFTLANNQPIEADAIIGTWLMPDGEGILEIFKENGIYNGKIFWMKKREEDGSPLKDKENPVDSLRNRTVEGLQVMSGFKYKGENLWSGGTFYAARKGKEAKPDFTLVNKNQLNIEISFFIFSKTIELKRIDTKQYFQNKS